MLIILSVIIAIAIGALSHSFLIGIIVFVFGLASMGDSVARSAKKHRRRGDPDYIYYDDL